MPPKNTNKSKLDQLTVITDIDELRQLRSLYQRKAWPAHCVGYYCLDNFIHWLEIQPKIPNLRIYTLNGDWRSEGLFLVVDRYQLFVSSLIGDNDNENLQKAIGLLDWRGGYKVSSFLSRHRSAVLNVIKEKQLEPEYDSETLLYYMPCKRALELKDDCPLGYEVRLMTSNDAETVDTLWPNRHRGSLFLIKRLIQWNANAGVYDVASGELVAWCLRLQGGFLGALQVKETHKRLGLGSVVARATSRRIAEKGQDVMALVNPNNGPSCGMFAKLGFSVTFTCHWLRTLPTKSGSEWPEGE